MASLIGEGANMYEERSSTQPKFFILFILWVVIIIAWAINWYFLVGDTQHRGTFGDMFGGLNALFTGLAFATLIYTAWMQKEELALQREELKATRDELKGQKEQLQQQSKTFELQRFETTFFSLLSTHRVLLSEININSAKGTSALRAFWKGFKADTEDNVKDIDVILTVYLNSYSRNYSQLGRYFRNLYHIFKFINSSSVEDKKFYVSLVRAQLTAFEQLMIFYNCLSPLGVDKFKPLVEQYSLLNNLPINQLIDQEHKSLYADRAYE
jgi:uncharacterized membrane protein